MDPGLERAAFEHVYAGHADRIYAYLCARVGRPAVAEELTAQVFLEAWRKRDSVALDPELGWSPWLFGVARNLVLQHGRGEGRLLPFAPDARDWGTTPDPAASLAETEERHIQIAAALAALGDLPAADRDVLELCVIGGMSPRQAAVVLDQPASTVRSRLTRARRRLRNLTIENLRSEQEETA